MQSIWEGTLEYAVSFLSANTVWGTLTRWQTIKQLICHFQRQHSLKKKGNFIEIKLMVPLFVPIWGKTFKEANPSLCWQDARLQVNARKLNVAIYEYLSRQKGRGGEICYLSNFSRQVSMQCQHAWIVFGDVVVVHIFAAARKPRWPEQFNPRSSPWTASLSCPFLRMYSADRMLSNTNFSANSGALITQI